MATVLPVPPFLRDPLLERDYVRLCSRPSFFRNRALAPALLGAVLLFMYGLRDEAGSPDEMGRSIHLVFTWLAALLTASTAAAETAVAIPTERSTGSLTVLLTVPRTPLRLAAGFFLSRVFLALTALLAVLPLEGFALLLGGVDISAMAGALRCILAFTVFGAAVGLFAGYDATNHRLAVGRSALLGLSLTVLLPLALAVAGLVLHDFRPESRSPDPDILAPDSAEEWLYVGALTWFFLTPLGGMATHTFEMSTFGGLPLPGLPPGITPERIHLLVSVLTLAGALVAILVTGRRLRADTERATVAAHRPSPWRWFLGLLGRRRPREADDVWPEALLWKEARPPRNHWVRWALNLAVLGWAVLLAWLWISPEFQANVTGRRRAETALFDAICSAPAWLFLLATAAACGTLIAEERERNALDLLRAAPFRARAFFLARFLGIGRRLLPLALATLPFVAYGAWMGIVHPVGVLAWGLGAALVAPFLALLSFRAGMAAATVRAAQRRVGMVMGVFIVGWPLFHWFLEEAFNARERVQQVVLCLNPFASVTGPYLLFARFSYARDADADLLRMGIAGGLAVLFWGLLALLLWWRLPGDLDRALHGADDA